jgi:hypothetical protein
MIDNYSFGSITINGKEYHSDVIIYPDTVNSSWWREKGHFLQVVDLEEIVEFKPEILIVGTGNGGAMKIASDVEEYLKSRSIQLIAFKTEMACQKFNELAKEKRAVAALHLTC